MFLAGSSMSLQDHIHHGLAIVKLDIHLDDPYLMDDAIAVVKFLLTGSAFQSTIPPVANIPQPHALQLTPYRPFQGSAQLTIPVPSFNLPPALKTEANVAACATLLCNWYVDPGVTILFPYCSILIFIHSCCLLTWRGRGNGHFFNSTYLLLCSFSTFSLIDLSLDLVIS